MKLIAHRGNLNGRNLQLENSPAYIMEAIWKGYDVEIDVWHVKNEFYLGHDGPEHKIWDHFFEDHASKLWIHCKDIKSLAILHCVDQLNVFFHDTDDAVLTSHGHIWTYPNKELTPGSICVMPELGVNGDIKYCYGICSDYPKLYK